MKGRIAVVSGEPNEIGALSALLSEEGYEVGISRSGESALEAFSAEIPELIVISEKLPDTTGHEVYARLSTTEGLCSLPVVLLGSTHPFDALERGSVDIVPLPYEPRELLARVKRLITVHRVRAALERSEAEFQSVTHSAIDAIISADRRGIVRSWNPAATRLFGFEESEMLDQPLDRIIPGRFRGAHHEGVKRVASGGETHVIGSTVEVAAVRRDGSEFPVELSLASWTLEGELYFTGILRDISERKEAEQKFRSVTESAIDAIVSANNRSEVIGWNRAAQSIFGWTEEEIVGKPLETIIPARYHDAHRAGMDRVTTTGEGRVIGQTVELEALHKEGHEFPIELSLSTWMVEGERYFTGIIRDISKRKEAEERLREYADELERKHGELKAKHEELLRSERALAASFRQAQRLFSTVTDGLPGAVLNGRYRLDQKIASGGFGVVYEAMHIPLERRVAVKVLRPPSDADDKAVHERFRREGITATRVNHRNAVAVLDLDVSEGGFPYIVMEYLHGRTLRKVLDDDGPLTIAEAARIAAEVCAVLAATHGAGIIHRDIKPSNVFLQSLEGEDKLPSVKVLDFGVAKLLDEPGRYRVTQTGELLGTPSYMAPERLRTGDTESSASDVFSVGVMLFESIAGRLPVEPGPDLMATIHAQYTSDMPDLRELRPEVPEALSRLVRQALSRKAGRRPSAGEMESMLREMLPALPGAGEWASWGPRDRVDPDDTTLTLLDRVDFGDEGTVDGGALDDTLDLPRRDGDRGDEEE